MKNEIEELQSRVTFQEDMIEILNKRVAEQQAEIDKLYLQLQHVYRKMNDVSDMVETGSEKTNERPPHY